MKTSELKSNEYHSYYQPYILALGEVELMAALKEGMSGFVQFIKNIPDDKLSYAYGEGKWTVAEVLMHLIDTERIFQYRALRFGRNDTTPLHSFEQDDYVPESYANERGKESILREYMAVRESTMALFSNFDAKRLGLIGTSGNAQISVAALGFIICGHQEHHKKVLEERYL